jgi:hypothetical protein
MLQSLLRHFYSIGRFHTITSPFSSRQHGSRWTSSNVSRLHKLPHCSRPLHTMARSHPHSGHHSRNRGTRPLHRLDIATVQGRQLESQLFHSLAKLCGIQLFWTTAHYPTANGLVEHFHRTLKTAITIKIGQRRSPSFTYDSAPLLKRICKHQLVYGLLLRIPAELLTPTAHLVETAHLITQLCQHMARLRPVPATCHASPGKFVHKDLNYKHVFLRQDSIHRAFEPPGPISERLNVKSPCTWQTHHRVC